MIEVSLSEVSERAAGCVFTPGPECLVKCRVDLTDPKIPVQHEQRLVEGVHNLLSTGQGRACVRRRRWSWRRRWGRRFRRGRFGHKETQSERTRHDRGSLALLRSASLHRSAGTGVPAYLFTVPLLRPASVFHFRVPLPRPTSASLQFTSPQAIGLWAVFYWLTVSLHRLTVGLLGFS